MGLLSRVRRTIREHDLARAGTRVIVALSGGPDSMALAHIIAALASAGDLAFAGLAHFNHRLRPTASRDEAFCREAARRLAVPIDIGCGDVAGLARSRRCSIETAAHGARYEFLEAAREKLGADVIALGHTRDDQAETFLLRLVRGAGARGLAAMHPRRGRIVRPLLDCRRAELVDWLADRRIASVVDESNDDRSIPRNRVRAELLPLLESRFNPAAVDALADAAALARGEWEWLEESADEALAAAATGSALELDVAALTRMPLALRRAVLYRAMSRRTSRSIAFRHVREVLRLLGPAGDGLEIDVPGQAVKRIRGRLVLTTGGRRRSPANFFEYSLSIPGEVLVSEAAGVISAEHTAARGWRGLRRSADMAVLRRDLCGTRLIVRNRRPGDRVRPVGLGGSRKLQDVFVDSKIDRAERDRIPVVADENGRILWVAGVGISDEFRVTDPAQPMLILRFKAVGGPA